MYPIFDDAPLTNLVKASGYWAPFAYVDDQGRVHVGDTDNHEDFESIYKAIDYLVDWTLTGTDLARGKSAEEQNLGDCAQAEYTWHCDAILTIEALETYRKDQ